MNRVLIIGASGQVGTACRQAFSATHEVIGTYASHPFEGGLPLNLEDEQAIRKLLREVKPNLCILCSAMTYVDGCEDQPDRATAINARAPGVIAGMCQRVVYLSTEYVFDGRDGPYREEDAPAPLGAYGRTKLEGERAVLQAGTGHLSVRTTVVYSYDPAGKNFAMQLWGNLRQGKRMKVPRDQISSPTYAPDLGRAIFGLTEKGATGVVNVAGSDILGRYDFAVRAAKRLGLDPSLLDPVDTPSLGQRAARPLNAGLRIDKLRGLLGNVMKGVDEGVDAFKKAASGAV